MCRVTHSHWTGLQPYNYEFDCSQTSACHRLKNQCVWKQHVPLRKRIIDSEAKCFRKISGFYHRIVEVFTLPGFYAALLVISLLAFRHLILIPTSRNRKSKNLDCLTPWPVKMGPMGCTETSVNTYRATLRKTQKSVELKHDFNIRRRSAQHKYHKNKVQIDNEGALWVRIPSTNIMSLPPPMIKSPTAC